MLIVCFFYCEFIKLQNVLIFYVLYVVSTDYEIKLLFIGQSLLSFFL